ncbi:MAG: hypothetical protein Q9212_005210 [Teloschistes hypoglaucus]
MSGVVIKLGSLLIRTFSKPVANYIKGQAREHPRFRRICISAAQRVHRLDMRLRLGLLQDTASIDKQIARDAAEAQAKRQKSAEVPTVKTEARAKADEAAVAKEKDKAAEKAKSASKPRIRPLSEAKAIDAGANFASETFLLSVGIGLIIFERWWSSRKETTRREDVSDRIAELEESEKSARRALVELEKELLRMRAKEGKEKSPKRILPKEVWELEEKEEEERQPKASGILSYLRRPLSFRSKTAVEQVNSEPLQSQEKMPKRNETHVEKPTATIINVWPFATSAESYRSIRQRQSTLKTHDIAIPVQTTSFNTDAQQRQLANGQQHLFLLLTAASLTDTERPTTISRIERFASITTRPKPAIAFLLAINPTQSSSMNGYHTYLTLQTILHQLSVTLDLLPVASSTQLLPLLNTYIGSPTPISQTTVLPSSRTLLQQVTATAPTQDGQGTQVLEDFLGVEDAKNIESFWAEEWICD